MLNNHHCTCLYAHIDTQDEFMGLEPRPHTITQTAVPSGMSVTSIVCRHESDASLAPFTVTGNSVVVTLAQGDHVRCTFGTF